MAYRDEVYWLERDKIAIASLDRTATSIANEFTGPVGSKTVTLFVVSTDDNFNIANGAGNIGPDESPNIPAEFHAALAHKALASLYSQDPNAFQHVPFFDMKFEKAIVEGKKYANTGRDGAAPKIKPAEY